MMTTMTAGQGASLPITSGDLVSYLGHVARVIHVFETTANIRFTEPVAGMSRQQDVYLTALLPVRGSGN